MSKVLYSASNYPNASVAIPGPGNLAQIASGSLSGASVTLSSLSSYTTLQLFLNTPKVTSAFYMNLKINASTASNYYTVGFGAHGNALVSGYGIGAPTTSIQCQNLYNNSAQYLMYQFNNCKNPGFTSYLYNGFTYDDTNSYYAGETSNGVYTAAEAVSSLVIYSSTGSWTSGTYILWEA